MEKFWLCDIKIKMIGIAALDRAHTLVNKIRDENFHFSYRSVC
jgi:hypothetical protein